MRSSWNEIRRRAARFADDWQDAHYEKGETQSFYNEFFEIFDVKRRSVARYEEHVTKLNNRHGFIDLFWPAILLVEQKSAGRDLAAAAAQAGEYFDALKEAEKPRYQLVCDFQTFSLMDRDEGTTVEFPLADLPNHVEAFGFIMGVEKRRFKDQDPVNIAASEMMGKLYDALRDSNYTGHKLELFLVRLLFCLFADDTGIFDQRNMFLELMQARTNPDGSDTGMWLSQLFETLNTPEGQRQSTLDEDLQAFPYINGQLFEGTLPMPAFDKPMRDLLIEACEFSWDAISPAVFGSLFQSVMDKDKRRAIGAHYTTEQNIIKVIEPLFLDDLRAELTHILKLKRDKKKRLEEFRAKLGGLTFMDPACGCGNFLIITYRELRQLEMEALQALIDLERDDTGAFETRLDVTELSCVNVDQFYGIELEEFPARIAEVAMWMMDHIMNNRLSLAFGQAFARIPLTASPHIHHGDALAVDWAKVLPAQNCHYILGNPPFSGAKTQSAEQRAQVRAIADLGKSGGTLDFVAAWFLKAGAYAQGAKTQIGFVATNSITQGEQVGQLWPLLFGRYGLEISFAHRTFAWGSEARGKAHVHVVIIGLAPRAHQPENKKLYSYDDINGDPTLSLHKALTAYLFDAAGLADSHVVVHETSKPINGARRLKTGVQMIDNGILTFSPDQMAEFVSQEPRARKFFRRYLGGDEYINGFFRWILYLADASPKELRELPATKSRVQQVREYRLSSQRQATLRLADEPMRVGVDERLDKPYLVIPNTSSERRTYVPIGWLTPEVIANQKLRILPDATRLEFGILTSAMHMAWMRTVTGRMKSDYMYSVGVVYNTFPWPEANDAQKARIESLAGDVLKARDAYPDSTLADLYDPDLMPADLRRAHQALDRAVDSLYRKAPFAGDRERVEHLFPLYEKMLTPLIGPSGKSKKSSRRKTTKS